MKVKVIGEYGFNQALLGLGLSYGLTSDKTIDDIANDAELRNRLVAITLKLLKRGGSHVKFLESIAVYMDITAPRYFHQQLDTYRIGISKQSESTMHTILKRPLVQEDFVKEIPGEILNALNAAIEAKEFESVKAWLPEGFLQRRIVCTNYKTLRHIVGQRHDHRLSEWQFFIQEILAQVKYPEYLTVGVVGL